MGNDGQSGLSAGLLGFCKIQLDFCKISILLSISIQLRFQLRHGSNVNMQPKHEVLDSKPEQGIRQLNCDIQARVIQLQSKPGLAWLSGDLF